MQVFTISTSFSFSLIIWSLILILIGRAANIFPLSFAVNRFRTVNISARMQFIMWFSGILLIVDVYSLICSIGKIIFKLCGKTSFKWWILEIEHLILYRECNMRHTKSKIHVPIIINFLMTSFYHEQILHLIL